MLAASSIAIFIVPVLFVIITQLSYGKKELTWLLAHHDELIEKAKRAEQQNIDPELEFEIAHDRLKNTLGKQGKEN
jgi:HAE1 family hydrophobic/amphiphilic exporter-1